MDLHSSSRETVITFTHPRIYGFSIKNIKNGVFLVKIIPRIGLFLGGFGGLYRSRCDKVLLGAWRHRDKALGIGDITFFSIDYLP